MNNLKFTYINYRGEEHEYVITPDEQLAFVNGAWFLSGQMILRDGYHRPEMGATRRRSFQLVGLRNVEEVPA